MELATDNTKPDMINLKELRNLLIGRRKNIGIVFVWGMNDERVSDIPLTLNK